MLEMREFILLAILVLQCTPANGVAPLLGLSPGAIAAAVAGIQAGTSLVGTTLSALSNINYRVVCGIEVENWTKFILSTPNVQIAGGVLEIPPRAILPGKREAMVARKTSGTATGSYGTVSWKIESSPQYPDRLIVIMWHAPYGFILSDNWLGLGLTRLGHTYHPPGDTWFDKMYDGSTGLGRDLGFDRKKFLRDNSALIYEDSKIKITGSMSSGHKAQVKITVRPQSDDDLADSIKALINKPIDRFQ